MLAVKQGGRSRSKSPGGRERDSSRSNVRDDRDDVGRSRRSSRRFADSESDESPEDDRRYSSSRKYNDAPPPDEGKRRYKKTEYDEDDRIQSRIEKPPSRRRDLSVSDNDRQSRYKSKKDESESGDDRRNPRKKVQKKSTRNDYSSDGSSSEEDNSTAIRRNLERKKSQPTYTQQPPGAFPDAHTRHMSFVGNDPRYAPPPVAPRAGHADTDHRPRAPSNANPHYADLEQYKYQYATVDPHKYKYKDSSSANTVERKSKPKSKYDDYDDYDDGVMTREKLEKRRREMKQNDDNYRSRDGEETARRVSRLSMSGAGAGATLGASLAVASHAAPTGGGKPPASPLLEAYRGTYQSISPMPSALVLADHKDDSDLSDLELEKEEPLESDLSSGVDDNDPNADIKRKIFRLEREKRREDRAQERAAEKKKKTAKKEYDRKRPGNRDSTGSDLSFMALNPSDIKSPRGSRKSVSFYDAEDDAKAIAAALKGTKPPNVRPLMAILPGLSIEDLDALKAEYKRHAKIEGQGINLSKHIKARVTGHLGKAAYATSLGQYESEGYWANCYYQVGASRRELLIESLMGRTNQQIREIKNFFKDKKYDDDLERCMKTELKADKFRSAILLALEERRMPETAPIDPRAVREDAQLLYDTLHAPGGESAMIQIIVLRSDAHLRQVLRVYEQNFGQNFARSMINKSKNLVGETLAHVLNGALNRPMRDALLLHQAIAETAPGKERAELLISRLVRMHWEPRHLEKVKDQYADRYGRSVESAIKRDIQAGMKTEEGLNWTNFCINLLRSSEL